MFNSGSIDFFELFDRNTLGVEFYFLLSLWRVLESIFIVVILHYKY